MKKIEKRIALPVAAVLLLLGSPRLGHAQAADEATTEEKAKEEAAAPPEFTWRLDPADFGVFLTDRETGSSKLEEYRDVSSGPVLPRLHLVGAGGDRSFELLAKDVRREDARYTMSYGLAGQYSMLVDWNRIPHRFGNDGKTFHSHTSPGVYQIADSAQLGLQSAIDSQYAINPDSVTFAFLDSLVQPFLAAAPEVDARLHRDRTLALVEVNKMGTLAGDLAFTYENRKGTRPYGAAFGFSNAIELPEPIDYDTVGATLAGEWRGERSGARFGYAFSRFSNHVDTLDYDNPFRGTDSTDGSAYQSPSRSSVNGPVFGRNVLAPDSLENRVFANGQGKIGKKGYFSGSFNYAVDTQDDPLVAYGTNTAINPSSGAPFDVTDQANLPVANADSSVHVLTANARAGFEVGHGVNLKFHYRIHDYDNHSSRIQFPGYVRFDAVWEDIGRITVPYGYRSQDLGVEAGFKLARATRATAGYTREHWGRSFREVEDTDEDRLRLAVDSRYWDRAHVRASCELGNRDASTYSVEAQGDSFLHPEEPNNLPDLRKFDQAPRDSLVFNLTGELFPRDDIDVTLGVTRRNDDYDESSFGLSYDRSWSYVAEVNYAVRKSSNAYAFWNRNQRDSFQQNRQSGSTPSTNPADDWSALLSEDTDTVGLGFATSFAKRWSADLSVSWNRANGNTELESPPGGTPDLATGFPEYDDNEWTTVQGKLEYRLSDHLSAGALYRYEDYTADRFAREGLDFYMPGLLAFNANDGDDQMHVVAVDLRLKF